jgi:hypothetical protein
MISACYCEVVLQNTHLYDPRITDLDLLEKTRAGEPALEAYRELID